MHILLLAFKVLMFLDFIFWVRSCLISYFSSMKLSLFLSGGRFSLDISSFLDDTIVEASSMSPHDKIGQLKCFSILETMSF